MRLKKEFLQHPSPVKEVSPYGDESASNFQSIVETALEKNINVVTPLCGEEDLILREVADVLGRKVPRLEDLMDTKPVTISYETLKSRQIVRVGARRFRVTLSLSLIPVSFLQLLFILWLQSQTLALRNRDIKLRREIAQTHELIAQKKNQISQLDSELYLSQLSSQMRWNKAPLTSFDTLENAPR